MIVNALKMVMVMFLLEMVLVMYMVEMVIFLEKLFTTHCKRVRLLMIGGRP